MQDQLDRMPDAMGVRRQTVEHPFGTLKAWMGANHFLTRTSAAEGGSRILKSTTVALMGQNHIGNLQAGVMQTVMPELTSIYRAAIVPHSVVLELSRKRQAHEPCLPMYGPCRGYGEYWDQLQLSGVFPSGQIPDN
jgi:hypothetical protein